MPRQRKPPKPHLSPEPTLQQRKLTHAATWIILDGGRQISTGLDASDLVGRDKAFADYIKRKHTASITRGPRSAENIPVADVLNLYVRDVVPKHSNPKKIIDVFK